MLRLCPPAAPALGTLLPVGALPPVGVCSDLVGQIQQTVNHGFAQQRFGTVVPMPLVVDGRAGQLTTAAIDAAMSHERWDFKSPQGVLNDLRAQYGAAPGAPFSCVPKATEINPWGPIAAGAFILAAVAFVRYG